MHAGRSGTGSGSPSWKASQRTKRATAIVISHSYPARSAANRDAHRRSVNVFLAVTAGSPCAVNVPVYPTGYEDVGTTTSEANSRR